MRIAMIQDDWFPLIRGGSVHVRELSMALAEKCGHEVDIYTRALTQDGIRHSHPKSYCDGAVSVIRLGPCTEYWNPVGRASSTVTPLPHLLRGEYDVVHGHTFLPAVPTSLGGSLTDAATVFTVHGTAITSGVGHDTTALSGLKRRIERLFVLGFPYDHVISVNREHLDLLSDAHEDVSYIPNGVDIERFDSDRETVDGRILFVGRLAPKKRVRDLIEAYETVAEAVPESELVIVGTGSQRDELEELVDRLDLSDDVTFEGHVPDDAVPDYYASAEVFALPSVWEGHPLTLLEAWAAGTPVVGTDVEGIAEFIEPGETGYLVPPESPGELADALVSALEDPSGTRQMGAVARRTATEEYSWEQAAAETDEVYRRVARDAERAPNPLERLL